MNTITLHTLPTPDDIFQEGVPTRIPIADIVTYNADHGGTYLAVCTDHIEKKYTTIRVLETTAQIEALLKKAQR
ncbi:MAG: hypothetical protein HUK20_13235 [Fibrobacter sp.]|nr:hypothetical protein [Fibrobacter sp.]